MQEGIGKYLSPALFVITAVCFTLPFITITTASPEPQIITGFDMVVDTVQGETSIPQPHPPDNTPTTIVLVAMVIAVIGFFESIGIRYLLRFKYRLMVPASSAFGGAILLVAFIVMANNIAAKVEYMSITYGYGLWLTLALFVATYLVNIYLIYKDVKGKKRDNANSQP
jgi:hypothetical protein